MIILCVVIRILFAAILVCLSITAALRIRRKIIGEKRVERR